MKKLYKNYIYTILLAGSVFIFSILFSCTLNNDQKKDFLSIEVSEGDTLWGIAEEYEESNLTKKEFIGWIEENNGVSADSIKPGQVIVIPVKGEELVQNLASEK
ncbi:MULTISPECIES: LysM peptidoglycan-binding domain-containing protein [unclassified Bacillus (in: firmicutes)]|uniref:cell division suppressor protein YneA n=1 Tax=unclassified Bacillus (in: firmicutes) TaxID=185979 RepID=UPI001BEBAB86|nr:MULTISPECIES: LysM peptidoglycan-binding domain-containing protein [unclassified Bacillus (in: firmicutes)]MBT2618059.1 LysM peptidoglycan-binding domain-containing protein [Bacillus sp. ISL-78]MBT2630132.1 LysM peptidoglycan-binding domain-containing protein [Bacillus sp. ISL-101]MBT2718685.1 LysM peptidoglycan-binding domain-containing protein [Bacillus sp. ISL-57]